jgi:hypothetical protein
MHAISEQRGIVRLIALARETALIQKVVNELVLGNACPDCPLSNENKRRTVES